MISDSDSGSDSEGSLGSEHVRRADVGASVSKYCGLGFFFSFCVLNCPFVCEDTDLQLLRVHPSFGVILQEVLLK